MIGLLLLGASLFKRTSENVKLFSEINNKMSGESRYIYVKGYTYDTNTGHKVSIGSEGVYDLVTKKYIDKPDTNNIIDGSSSVFVNYEAQAMAQTLVNRKKAILENGNDDDFEAYECTLHCRYSAFGGENIYDGHYSSYINFNHYNSIKKYQYKKTKGLVNIFGFEKEDSFDDKMKNLMIIKDGGCGLTNKETTENERKIYYDEFIKQCDMD